MNALRTHLSARNILTALVSLIAVGTIGMVMVWPTWTDYRDATDRRDALSAGISADQQTRLLEAVSARVDLGRVTTFVQARAGEATIDRVEDPGALKTDGDGRSAQVAIVVSGTPQAIAGLVSRLQGAITVDPGSAQLVRADEGAMLIAVDEVQMAQTGSSLQATLITRFWARPR